MKSTLLKTLLLLAVFGLGFACAPKQAAEEADVAVKADDPKEEEAPVKTVASTDSYTTVVVKDGIASPRKEMKGKAGGVEITVNYGSPSVKGREVWGGIVPYGEVWRTGANENTTITFSGDATIEGQALAAGTYGLFTVPNKGGWVVIFSKTTDSWGSNGYDTANDVLRVTVTAAEKEEVSEAMEFTIEGDALTLHWDKLSVPVKVGAASEG